MKQRFNYLLIIIAILISSGKLFSAPYSQLGVNLVDQGVFINIMNHTNRFNNADSFDENGWPESDFELTLMDGRPAREWADGIDDPEEYRIDYSGTYECSFEGEADISHWGSGATIENKIWDEQSNITYFDLVIPGPPGANHGIVNLTFTNTTRRVDGPTNTGITNLKVLRPGYDLNTLQIFTDEYINLCKAANFACYRYYTLQNIWDGEPEYPETTTWDKRKIPLDASQQPMANTIGKLDAWCWEYIIELSNILKKDIWICIHMSCDSNYVVNLAEMLKDQLDPAINIYVENSNEVWSPTHKTHGPYNKAQADEYEISFDENYARRTVDLSNWFAEVFGKNEINNRIRVILAGQHSYLGRHDPHLNYISNNIGAPKEYVYALSTALYFGSTKTSGSVEEINEGMIESIDEQINNSENSGYRKAHIDKANEWELPGGCTSYEGGPHLPAGGGKDNLDRQINAHRTEAMKDVLKRNFAEGWFDIGGELAMQFTLSSGYNRYGCWGLTDDYSIPDRNYKMQAMRELVGEWEEEVNVIEYINDNGIKIYPNPFRERITIEFVSEESGKIAIDMYNQLGIKIQSLMLLSEKNQLMQIDFNCKGLGQGIYYYKISYGKHYKFIKSILKF